MFVTLNASLPQPITMEQVFEHGWHPIFYQLDKALREPESVIETNSQNVVRVLYPALALAVFFFVARALCKKYIFNSLGRRFGIKSKGKLAKFGYQFWLAAAYTASTCFGLWAFSSETWWSWPLSHNSSMELWKFENESMVSPMMWFYYIWGTGFYTAELFAIFVEPKRSDFAEYVVHHLTTICLLLSSAYSYNFRFGCAILFLHDFTDIFLCVAKICHYLNKEFWVNVNFVSFLVSFAWLRLWCFPCLLEATLFHAPVVRGFELGFAISQSLLCVLLVLHVYWFTLVCQMVYRLLTGTTGDVRSQSDTDGGSDTKKTDQNDAAKKME